MNTKSKRRTQEQRRAEARELLSRAAFELILENGYANFRVAAVAARAGVSTGGQLYHFPTKSAMTLAAIEYASTLSLARTEHHLESFEFGDDPILAIIGDSKDWYFSDSFDVVMDISKSVSHDEEMRSEVTNVLREYRGYVEQSWLQRFIEAGWVESEAQDLIDMTTSMVRGFGVRQWLLPDRAAYDRQIERWSEMAAQYFTPPANKKDSRKS